MNTTGESLGAMPSAVMEIVDAAENIFGEYETFHGYDYIGQD